MSLQSNNGHRWGPFPHSPMFWSSPLNNLMSNELQVWKNRVRRMGEQFVNIKILFFLNLYFLYINFPKVSLCFSQSKSSIKNTMWQYTCINYSKKRISFTKRKSVHTVANIKLFIALHWRNVFLKCFCHIQIFIMIAVLIILRSCIFT